MQAQVGINTTSPNATLDITASDVSTPSNNDGLLIPRIDEFPGTDPTASQDGMLVFVTGNGSVSEGFYYWNHGTTSWDEMSSDQDIDWYEVGGTSAPDNINDEIFTFGKVAIGATTPGVNKLSILDGNPSNLNGISLLRTLSSDNGSGFARGISSILSITGGPTNSYTGIFSELVGTYSGQTKNFSASSPITANSENVQYESRFSSTGGTGNLYGFESRFISNVTNSGTKYGFYANIPNTLSGTHYGIYTDVQNSSGYAGYFIGRTSLGATTSNRYLMPEADGTSGQVMTTDGSGNITFQTPSGDNDWTIVGSDIERQSGNVYIGDDNATDNDLYISNDILDWDNTTFLLDPSEESVVNEINFDAGSATDPSIYFDADSNTGFYRPETDAIGISTNGVDRFRFTSRGQIEFFNTGNSVFLGTNAGNNDDASGRQNIGIGTNALRDNTDGDRNIAIGSGAMIFNDGGSLNVAIGDDAMAATTTGSSNTGVGIQALFSNTTGGNNVAIGATSMRSNTQGSNNIAMGDRSLWTNTTGNNNIAIGPFAGFENPSGSNNTYVGSNAGRNNEGSGNVFVGNQSGTNDTTGSNRLYIENTNSATPLIYGEFDNDFVRVNGGLQVGIPSGTGYAFPAIDGSANQILQTDGAGQISFIDATSVISTNTLDKAYDEGGAGAGRTITADNGAVDIQGTDGLRVEGNISAATNIVHDGDIDTNIQFNVDRVEIDAAGVNYIDIENSNSEITFNENSNAIDFRIESDGQTNMFFVDGSQNAIGVGKNTPRAAIDIGLETPFDLDRANIGQDAIFITGNNSQGVDVVGGSIALGGSHPTRKNSRSAAIASLQTGNDVDFTGLAFYVHGNAISTVPMFEGMRLSHEGYLGINNTAPSATLDVVGTMQFVDGNETNGYVLASDAGGNATWTDPASLISSSDNQTIDSFTFNTTTNILTLEIEDDGIPAETVDLSSLEDEDSDWLTVTGNVIPTSNTDDIYTSGNVGINTTSNNGNLNINHNEASDGSEDWVISNSVSNSGNDNKIIMRNIFGSAQAGNNTAMYNILAGNGSGIYRGVHNYSYASVTGEVYGVFNSFSPNGNGNHYGTRTSLTGSGSGTKYGTYTTISSAAGGTHYGIYSDVTKSGSFAGYFLGNISIGTTTGNNYILPASRGLSGQVMQTDAVGNVSWVTPTSSESTTASNGLTESGDDIQLGGSLTQATSVTQGSFNMVYNLTGSGDFLIQDNGGDAFAVEDSGEVGIGTATPVAKLDVRETSNTAVNGVRIVKTDNTASVSYGATLNKTTNGNGTSYGMGVSLAGSGTGTKYGMEISLTPSSSGVQYGLYTRFSSAASALRRGTYNSFNGSGSGTRYGLTNDFNTSVSGAQIGVTNIFDGTTGNYTGMDNQFTGTTNNAAFGIINTMSGSGTGAKTGLSNAFSGANGNSNTYIGLDNSFNDTGNGGRWGIRNNMDGSGNGIQYGILNDLTGSGSGNKYGTYNNINAAAGGTHYGTFNEVSTSTGWAGYFVGRNYISDRLSIGETDNSNARINILSNSGNVTSHIELKENQADDGARIRMTNNSETTNSWLIFGRADNTIGDSRFNINHTTTGNILHIRGDGRVGINDSDPTYALELPNNATTSVGQGRANNWVTYSDSRIKKNQKELAYGLKELMQITPKSYQQYASDFKDEELILKEGSGKNTIGFIAQELFEIIPEATFKPENENNDLWSVDYQKILPVAVNAIKELNDEVTQLKSENEKLKTQLTQYQLLEARITALENSNNSNKETPSLTINKD